MLALLLAFLSGFFFLPGVRRMPQDRALFLKKKIEADFFFSASGAAYAARLRPFPETKNWS